MVQVCNIILEYRLFTDIYLVCCFVLSMLAVLFMSTNKAAIVISTAYLWGTIIAAIRIVHGNL